MIAFCGCEQEVQYSKLLFRAATATPAGQESVDGYWRMGARQYPRHACPGGHRLHELEELGLGGVCALCTVQQQGEERNTRDEK